VSLPFEWDPSKARENLRKHGISFDEAKTVFSDDQAILVHDPDHSSEEDRFILLGLSAHLRILVVVHAYRLISARKATSTERAQYSARWMR
jgi:uncharacterized DUF497 family protein